MMYVSLEDATDSPKGPVLKGAVQRISRCLSISYIPAQELM